MIQCTDRSSGSVKQNGSDKKIRPLSKERTDNNSVILAGVGIGLVRAY